MTILAIFVQPELILAATDTITFREHRPTGAAPKMVVNPTACAIGCGLGNVSLQRDADEAVRTAIDFDSIPAKVAKALRASVAARAATFDAEPDRFMANLYAVAGWSSIAGRMLVYTFAPQHFFAPVVGSSIVCPRPPELQDAFFPGAHRDLVRVARSQAAILEEDAPGAGAGPLIIAELRPGTISTRAIPEYLTTELSNVH